MQSDRELLELAAKAAGYPMKPYTWNAGTEFSHAGFRYDSENECASEYEWNPLEDDGDALRLAVKLRLDISHNHPSDQDLWVSATPQQHMVGPVIDLEDEGQRAEATRRCIVRAAASIGEQHGVA